LEKNQVIIIPCYNEIKTILPIIIEKVDLLAKKENNVSFENLLKLAMNHLDNSSNLARWRSIIE